MRFTSVLRQGGTLAALVGLLLLASCQPGGRRSSGEANELVVSGSDPAMSAQNAYLDQSITIQFNQDIDPNTVNEGTVRVVGPNGTVNGTYLTNFSQVIFTPLQNFSTNTNYSVSIPGWSSNPFCILSVKGDGLRSPYLLSYKTGTQYVPDTDPPSVTALYVSNGGPTPIPLPTDNSTTVVLDISPATSIVVDFDEGMNPSSFSPVNFSLIDQNNPTTPLNGTFRFFNKNARVVFYPATTNPGGFLSLSSNYTLLLTAGLMDNSLNPGNNALTPAPIQAAFRTRAAWNQPSGTSPYAEDFSSTNMLDSTQSNAIWNTAPTAQRLEGGYGAAALSGSGTDGDFTPTQPTVLNTTTRPFGFQYNNVNVPVGVVVTFSGSRPAILRARSGMTMAGVLIADGGSGTGVVVPGNTQWGTPNPGGPGGSGGPGGYSGGSGNPPANSPTYPWRSTSGSGPYAGQGGEWSTATWSMGTMPWPLWIYGNTMPPDVPGSGGGAGNSVAGGPGIGSNVPMKEGTSGAVNANSPANSNFQSQGGLPSVGGSGGGGGGGNDHSPAGWAPGDQILAFPPDSGGGGGGGGGGVINLTSAATLTISGTVLARGGAGGSAIDTVFSWQCYPVIGVGGGGGSGGCILVQALDVNVAGGTFNVSGGAGAIGGYTGAVPPTNYASRGGAGGAGWIRFESVSGTIIGEASANITPNTPASYSKGQLNLSTTQAQSLFFDTRVEDPDYLENTAGGFTANVVLNSGTIQIFAQGADADSRGEPDTQTYWPNDAQNLSPSWTLIYDSTQASPYTNNLSSIDRYRFIRFRTVFGNLLNVYPPGPFLNDVTFPFRD